MTQSKTCFKCGVIKPLDEFYTHPKTKDGRLGKCKECTRSDVRTNRQNNLEYYKAYDRKRAMREDRVAARGRYQKTDAGKAALRRAHKVSWAKYPKARWATGAVAHAIRENKIIRPKECSECHVERRLHAHHDDYAKPLDVRWLCTTCHREWHKHHTPRNRT